MSGHQSQRAMLKAEKKDLTRQIKELAKKLTGIERMLDKLDAQTARPAGAAHKAVKAKRSERTGRRTNQQEGGLPKTGGEFWISMMGKRPRSFTDVVTRAEATIAKSMKKELTEDDKRKLSLRARVAIKTLADTKAINSVGSGRARRYSAHA
ncbi:hypothetical protein [Noviherbaspirillum saxi]|nr:hypothetical protein [Noviherbaspirillum saxi]